MCVHIYMCVCMSGGGGLLFLSIYISIHFSFSHTPLSPGIQFAVSNMPNAKEHFLTDPDLQNIRAAKPEWFKQLVDALQTPCTGL